MPMRGFPEGGNMLRIPLACRRRFGLILAFLTIPLLLPVSGGLARASQFLQWPDGSSFTTFGPNAAVTIDLGAINYVNTCPSDSGNDSFFAFADIYVVPSGSVSLGMTLKDVSNPLGIPDTVQGSGVGNVFIDETIGFTAPSGHLKPGTYAVIYDECQDGKLDA